METDSQAVNMYSLLARHGPVRACPICPKCGSKRFERLPGNNVTVKCRSCDKIISI